MTFRVLSVTTRSFESEEGKGRRKSRLLYARNFSRNPFHQILHIQNYQKHVKRTHQLTRKTKQ